MPTVALDVFLPYIRMEVAGCPDPVLKEALLKVATDFCTRSLCWNEQLTAVSVTDASFPYTLPVAAHATLTRLLAARAPGKLLPITYTDLDMVTDWETQKGSPSYYLFDGSGRLILFPLPSSAVQMKLRVALTPSRSATVLEEFLYTKWRDALVHGAVAELKSTKDRAWTDIANVPYHFKRFETGLSDATVEAMRSFNTAGQSVQMRPLA